MSAQNTSQSHNDSHAFDPVVPFILSLDAWSRLAHENMARVQSLWDEMAGIESEVYERARRASKDLGRIYDDSINYCTELTGELRKLSLEATRRSIKLFQHEA